MNPLRQLNEFGQSVWLDFIRRKLLIDGELERLIRDDGLAGVTSNPAIFEKAVTGSDDYAEDIATAAGERGLDAEAIYERIAIEDVRRAADILAQIFETTDRRDGYVSLEVSPHLAYDTERTCREARRLRQAVDRENLMIKVPATNEGLPAIETLLAEGINVNVTLLFSADMYERVVAAYKNGVRRLVDSGGRAERVASVASFFVSRIDNAVDKLIEDCLQAGPGRAEQSRLQSLRGQAAIANAKLAYQRYKGLFDDENWRSLAGAGARTQRMLWASTSTKNPDYRDVLYVEELIGRDTVNTIPPVTMDAFREHGRLRPSLEEDVEQARRAMDDLAAFNISINDVTSQLLDEGVRLFEEAYDKLLGAVKTARSTAIA